MGNQSCCTERPSEQKLESKNPKISYPESNSNKKINMVSIGVNTSRDYNPENQIEEILINKQSSVGFEARKENSTLVTQHQQQNNQNDSNQFSLDPKLKKKLLEAADPEVLEFYNKHGPELKIIGGYQGESNPYATKLTKTSDGSYYLGQINQQGQPEGFGILVEKRGTILTGAFIREELNGPGMEIIPQRCYLGNFVNGMIEGEGKIYFQTGAIFKGNFIKGLREGNGTIELEGQRYFKGTFKEDKETGEVVIDWPKLGSKYEGHMIEGVYNGKGKM